MKKSWLFRFVFIFLLYGCNDGDLQIETLDFDSFDIQNCETVDVAVENVLFKINSDEALILELPVNLLVNEVGTVTSTVSESGPSKITYRIFSDVVTNDYFCASVPLTEPQVLEEIPAKSGDLTVVTTTTDSLTFSHEITFNEISLVTATNNRITDLTINEFGTVTTVKPADTDAAN